MTYALIRPLLFALPPESAHSLALGALGAYGQLSSALGLLSAQKERSRKDQGIAIAGLRFPSALGLAAGFDKDARAILGMAALGASHVEVGTLTLRPQQGNPRPRVFRLNSHQALINRMGFPNQGVMQAIPRLIKAKRACPQLIIGANIGKNKDTPLEQAHQDYCALITHLYAHCDYITVNISSPNTEGLRDLQAKEALATLLGEINKKRQELRPNLPIFIKIAPDLDDAQLQDSIEQICAANMDAVIATNTTLDRSAVQAHPHAAQQGGLSGAVLHPRSLAIVRKIRAMNSDLPIIAAGGIHDLKSAQQSLAAGANLLQAYSGLVYHGPMLFKTINKALSQAQ